MKQDYVTGLTFAENLTKPNEIFQIGLIDAIRCITWCLLIPYFLVSCTAKQEVSHVFYSKDELRSRTVVGTLAGKVVSVPFEFEQGTTLLYEDLPHRGVAFTDAKAKGGLGGELYGISVVVRRANFRSIQSHEDLVDWATYHNDHNHINSIHSWIGFDFFKNSETIPQMIHNSLEKNRITSAQCEEKFGLSHCIFGKYEFGNSLKVTQIFYDPIDMGTYLECNNAAALVLSCTHYFQEKISGTIGTTFYLSEDEIRGWKYVESNANKLVDFFTEN